LRGKTALVKEVEEVKAVCEDKLRLAKRTWDREERGNRWMHLRSCETAEEEKEIDREGGR